MSLSRPLASPRNEEECVDTLINALEAVYPDLDVTVLVIRLIAEFVPYRTWIQEDSLLLLIGSLCSYFFPRSR